MAERIKNIPSPDILMNSLRSIGYSFKTALADIIDNSISVNAKNIWIDFPRITVIICILRFSMTPLVWMTQRCSMQ